MRRAKKYLAIANRSFQNTIAYRNTYVISLAGYFVNLFAMYYLWMAIYDGREQLVGFTWEQMKAYLVVSFFANSLLSYYSESRIAIKILDGSVAMDLLKPLDFQKANLAETLGACVVESAVGAVLVSMILIASVGIETPPDVSVWCLFLVSLAASIFVKFGIIYITGLLCFWTTGSIGIIWTRMAITNLLSGALVPLAFFPAWLHSLAMALPFQGMIHTPASIFLGTMDKFTAVQMIGIQLFWAAVLWIAGQLMWKWAVRQVTIHGG